VHGTHPSSHLFANQPLKLDALRERRCHARATLAELGGARVRTRFLGGRALLERLRVLLRGREALLLLRVRALRLLLQQCELRGVLLLANVVCVLGVRVGALRGGPGMVRTDSYNSTH
jgi:hypothetical protein